MLYVLYCTLVGAQMDVKLRSLICLGLNEACLHLWWDIVDISITIDRYYIHRYVDV